MLAADSGLAPPPSNYIRSRPSDDHTTGRADQSSEATVRSRNRIEGLAGKSELKSATQKINKKKAEDAIGIHDPSNKNNMSASNGRKKSQSKLYTGKLIDSTGMS